MGEKTDSNNLLGLGLLLLAALVWGLGFAAQSIGADHVGPYTFLAYRNWISFLLLFPVIRIIDLAMEKRKSVQKSQKPSNHAGELLEGAGQKMVEENRPAQPIRKGKMLWLSGSLCGVFLFLGSATQQIGIAYTTAAKAGFLTAMYVVIVPVIYAIIKRGIGIKIWISVALAVCGLYLLCISGGFSLGYGDSIVLLCALFYSLQMLCIDRFVPQVDAIRLTQIQFLVVAVLSTILMLILENQVWTDIRAALPAILYTAIFSSAVGFTLQTVGQSMVKPTVCGIAMSMESVFAAIGGWLFLHELLTRRELSGCAVMLAAILLAQIPIGRRLAKRKTSA